MKSKQKPKKETVFLAMSIISILLSVFLIFVVYKQRKQIEFNLELLKNHRDVYLENDLRNRGIIQGELLQGETKPYSLEQMEEFKKWAENREK